MAVETPETSKINSDTAAEFALPTPEAKHEYVRTMFDAIAPRYDLLNSVFSARMHHHWRRVAVAQTALSPGDAALDVCTGTGDLAFELARCVGKSGSVIGSDFSAPMLSLAEKKRENSAGLSQTRFTLADTMALPFSDNTFDAVTVGFGIRNVSDIQTGLREMVRVLRPGGRAVILEFSQPQNPVLALLYRWYSFTLLPFIGGLISGRRSAYQYLPSSVAAFYSRQELSGLLSEAGLAEVGIRELAFGAVVVHRGTKPLCVGNGKRA